MRLVVQRHRFIAAVFVGFSVAVGAALQAETTNVSLRWLSLPNAAVAVNGLPWYAENNGALTRLPLRSKESFRPAVWNLAQSPSGGRIRLRTDTRVLTLRLEYPSPPNMANMHAFGQTGVDVYADGVYLSTAIAGKEAKTSNVLEHVSFDFADKPRTERQITVYLPLYKPVKVQGLGVDKDAKVSLPKPFALPKPVVFYGTSITQGGCASRPGMSYPAILGRMLNIDFVNLGFSGNGLGEPEMARAVAGIDAACFVLDFGANHKTSEDMERAYAPFLEVLRAKHPRTPILAVTPIYTVREVRFESLGRDWQKRREHIREVVNRHVAAGEKHLHLVEGTDLLGPSRADGLVDGGHPNDLGFHWMAEGLAPCLRLLLELR